jgi:hypothetical protein
MTINHPATIPESVRKIAHVALFTAAIALSTTAFGHTAVPIAEPNNGGEWDIEAYDNCMAKTIRSPISCCLDSGGWLGPVAPDGSETCVAPPAAPAGSTQQLNPNLPQPTRETLPPGPGQPLPDQPAS